ncbi:MAG: DUF4956 domain-containing protein, partial [Chloroflexi bacterium]|nr:DUF4956 domain-containing protein [Chloroflexota bacterium]
TITYEKINLIRPENHSLLLADLEERTGLEIKRLEIGKIDLLRDTARVQVFYNNGHQPLPLQISGVKDPGDEITDSIFTK